MSGLHTALVERDRLRGFEARLESLNAEGALSATEYAAGSLDYASRIATVTARIDSLKSAIRKELEACDREVDICRLRMEGSVARSEAGELTPAQLQGETRKWGERLRDAENQKITLEIAMAAETAVDLADSLRDATHESRPAVSMSADLSAHDGPHAGADLRSSAGSRGWTSLRVVALAAAIILLVSVRLAWLAPTELLGNSPGAEPGVSVSFVAGLGGIACGFLAIGAALIGRPRTRGTLHMLAGCLALVALAGAIYLGELPLNDSYFRELVVLREGFFMYVAIAATLVVLGYVQVRRWA